MNRRSTTDVRVLSKPSSNVLVVFVSCAPGLEPMLAEELRKHGVRSPVTEPGGVSFTSGRQPWYRALLWSGLASHVLVRVGQFEALRFEEMVHRCAQLPWEQFLEPGAAFDVRAVCRHSKLYHSDAVEERIAIGVLKRLACQPAAMPTEGEILPMLRVRMQNDVCTVSLAPTPEPLHRRGYRVESGTAPLREDLAHALLLASGWQPGDALLDPFAGTGTIPIEAAMLALGRAPALRRPFAWDMLALDDRAMREEIWEEAASGMRTELSAPIRASDRDERAVAAIFANAEAAETPGLEIAQESLSEAAWLSGSSECPPRGALVCNPPFGARLSADRDLRALWQTLGRKVMALPEDWRFAALAEHREYAYSSGLALRSAFLTEHGGRKVNAFVREEEG